MKKIQSIIVALIIFCIGYSQEQNPFYIGHSLVNFDMPAMVQGLAEDAGKTTYYDKQIINGSPLQYNYNNASNAQGTPYTTAFPNGNFNTLVITEAVPLQNHLSYSDTYLFADNFYNYAKNNNNGVPIRFYIYETWHCINSGIPSSEFPTGCAYDDSANSNTLWHPRLQADFSLWSGIVTDVRNENTTDNEIWMVPAGQAFYELTTQINAGNVPGISSFTELFQDDIHLTNAGNYFVACVMYATVYRASPIGLTTNLNNQYNTPFTDMPTAAQATIMQQVAWDTVTNLSSWTGASSTLSDADFDLQTLSVYPNPSSDFITVSGISSPEHYDIYNILGAKIKKGSVSNTSQINIQNLANGMYILKLANGRALKFVKE